MLGINSPREPIGGMFAKEIRASLRRATTGRLTEAEKERRRQLKDTEKEWTAVWKLKPCTAVGFYESCDFAPSETKKPYKDTLRMYMTLYAKG